MIDHRLIRDRLIRGMSRLLESRRQDRMKEINLKVSSPEKKKEMLSGRVHTAPRGWIGADGCARPIRSY